MKVPASALAVRSAPLRLRRTVDFVRTNGATAIVVLGIMG
jgi:hypothetical protein